MNSLFRILDAAVPSDRDRWIQSWGSWPTREVQAHPDYVVLFAAVGDQSCAILYEANDGTTILYPFILRRIEHENQTTEFTDMTTPYGYGGPVYWGAPLDTSTVKDFWSRFETWATENSVVSEFVRFGIFSESAVPYPGERIQRQINIVVPLSKSEDELWRSFDPKVRKNVKRAIREGVEIQVVESSQGFDEFSAIYTSTMERRSASEGYYFPQEFFQLVHSGLSGQFAYFHASHQDKIVSTELVLVSADSVYSFLGGTDPDAFSVRPNDLLKFEIMRWSQARGKANFVLGGGFMPGDGIERYKRAFAPTGGIDFFTGQRILDQGNYDALAGNLQDQDPSGFFPAYRRK